MRERPESAEKNFESLRRELFGRIQEELKHEEPADEVDLFIDIIALLNEDPATVWRPMEELKLDTEQARRRNFHAVLWYNCDIQFNWLKQKTTNTQKGGRRKVERFSVDIIKDNEIVMALKLERNVDGELRHFTESFHGATSDFDTTEGKIIGKAKTHQKLQEEIEKILEQVEKYWD
ncbi:MAG: hypothetical protein Q7R85_01535 [bacterium]|nr:hypothetical protein [bacterium]